MELRGLINFEIIKLFNFKLGFEIYHRGKYTFLLKDKEDKIIKKYIFDEKKLDINWIGFYQFRTFTSPKKIQGSEDLFLIKRSEGDYFYYLIQKDFSK